MAKTYAVLFGQRGVKEGFRTMAGAEKFAQAKANSMGKPVEIDHIQSYSSGPFDWSQGMEKRVFPQPKSERPKVRRKSSSPLNFKIPSMNFRMPRF